MLKLKENHKYITFSKLLPNSKGRMEKKKAELEAKGYFCCVQENGLRWILIYSR